MNFQYIKWCNFLSTGNDFITIRLDKSRSTLIYGKNGHGKSQLLDALTFNLYGKAFRDVNIPQLVNTITNKNCITESAFTIGKKRYKVIRGLSPAIFEIYENDKLVSQDAAKKDYQAYLEKKIIRMTRKTFGQIVILGSANYVPFMKLPAHNRRDVIEDLLDIQVFSTMNILLKEKKDQNKKAIEDIGRLYGLLEQKIKLHEKHLRELKQNNTDLIIRKRNQIHDYKKKIDDLNIKDDSYNIEIQKLSEQIEDSNKISSKITKLLEMEKELSTRNKNINKEISFFRDNDSCPTCKQTIDNVFKCGHIDRKTARQNEITEALEKIDKTIAETNIRANQISEITKKITEITKKISENSIEKRSMDSFIKSIDNEISILENKKIEYDSESIDFKDMEKERKTLDKQKENLINQKEIYNIANFILKDTGIKTKIIKQYIPIMNKLINKYLAQLEFFVDFQLSENFAETIKSRYRDNFSYGSFSEGQKLRIDLAIMMTWRTVAKMRNSTSCNLLILDEILDSSADAGMVDSFFNLLEDVCKNDNLFLISPKGEMLFDRFQSSIQFELNSNFSRMV